MKREELGLTWQERLKRRRQEENDKRDEADRAWMTRQAPATLLQFSLDKLEKTRPSHPAPRPRSPRARR